MVNACNVFQQTTCIVPQAVVLYRGRDKVLPPRYFDLGRYGAPINAVAVAWVTFLNVVYCFPIALPVTATNMSYVSVVCIGLFSFVIVLWFTTKRGTFKGPLIDLDLLHARRMDAIRNLEVTGHNHGAEPTTHDQKSLAGVEERGLDERNTHKGVEVGR